MANKFKTAYEGHTREIVPSGTGFEDVWQYETDKYGRKVLVKTGEKNLYEEIQASLEDTKIENILARAAAGEDVFRPNGIFADVSEIPTNLIEARQAITQLENTWNGLTQDMRNKYNNSVEDFIAKSGTEEWMKDMGLLPTEVKEMNKDIKGEDKGLAPLGQTTAQAKANNTEGGVPANE